jgi:hypothetical protein
VTLRTLGNKNLTMNMLARLRTPFTVKAGWLEGIREEQSSS